MQIHPAGPMCRHLCSEIFAALDIVERAASDILADIEGWRGVGSYDAPIHPEIIDHFGLGWAGDLKYRQHAEGCFTHDEFVRRYIRLEWTPAYYRGVHLAAQNRLREAEGLLIEAVAVNPSDEIRASLD